MAYTWSFTNGNNTYTSANIVSGSLNEALYTECSIGNVTGKQLNLKLWNVTLDTSSPIVLSVSDGSSTMAKGTYFIDKYSTSPYSEYAEVTAFDAILKTEVVFMKEGEWAATNAATLVEEIADIIGVEVEAYTAIFGPLSSTIIDQAPSIGENGTTCRQILQTIGALLGGNWIINDANKLTFIPLFGRLTANHTRAFPTTASYTIGDEVVNFDKSDAEPIVGIEFQANGGQAFRYPSDLTDEQWEALDGRILYNNLPFMASQEAVDAVGAVYVASTGAAYGIPYIPYSANTAFISPSASLGYIATIKDVDVYLTNRTINIDALASCDLSAETSRKAESYYPYISPQVREARQKAEENYAAITVLPTQIMSEVYTKGETDERISTIVTQTASDITTTFTREVSEAVGEANQYTDGKTEVVTSYIREFDDGVETGIEIGRSDNAFKARLSNKELAFTGEDGEKAAWISSNQLYVNQMVTPGSSGKWVQQTSSDDHLQIRWVSN